MQNLQRQTETFGFDTEQVSLNALDGYVLNGVIYSPTTVTIKAKIILASATGVPQGFYRRFSEYMTQYGYQVLTFDYRGVGASSPKNLKGFEMSYLDWGKLDLAGAIDYFADEQLPLFVVGHSYARTGFRFNPQSCQSHCHVLLWHRCRLAWVYALERKIESSGDLEYCLPPDSGCDRLFAMEQVQYGCRLT